MLVVSDASPVLNLAIIGRLDLLQQQFGKVWLPQAVIGELRLDDREGRRVVESLERSV